MSEPIRPEPRTITSWQIAEENAADWMRAWGYPDVALTKAGADKGVDIRASGAIAQVKFEAAQVGRPAVQRLVGARGNDYGLVLVFFTEADYSREAISYADEVGIGLYQYALDGSISSVNERARQLAAAHGLPVGPAAAELEECGQRQLLSEEWERRQQQPPEDRERQQQERDTESERRRQLLVEERARQQELTEERLRVERERVRVEFAYKHLWISYKVRAESFERSRMTASALRMTELALRSFDDVEDRFEHELPGWWIVPPPENWRDNNPDKQERQRELAQELLKAERQRARAERSLGSR